MDLPGHGNDSGDFGDLHVDSTRVRKELDRLGNGVVLVGHSYAGAVITEAGDHPAVEHLVYVAGFPLDTDESCVNAALGDPGADQISRDGRPDFGSGFVYRSEGSVTLDDKVSHWVVPLSE